MREWVNRLLAKIGMDKLAHFFGSAFVTLALGKFIHWGIAAGTALVLGAMKEVLDKKADWRDLLADFLGVLLATIIYFC